MKGKAGYLGNEMKFIITLFLLSIFSTLTMAQYCNDLHIIDKLADLYNQPARYLQSDRNGDIVWLGRKKDLSKKNYEIVLYSTRFYYALSKLLKNIITVPANKRTTNMNNFLENYIEHST